MWTSFSAQFRKDLMDAVKASNEPFKHRLFLRLVRILIRTTSLSCSHLLSDIPVKT